MILRLHESFPKTIETFLEDLPNVGSWLDFKKLHEISSLDVQNDSKSDSNWRQVRQSRINFNKKLIDIWVAQCQLDEITMNSTTHTDRRFEACAQLARKMCPSLCEVDR
mmetsp:Transcript_6322/g.8798  ORF Transcript_6322/g.8798 Transcript_6322/m.8798 type:complete len:109 (+) Transcript_6322:650-976(+)